MKLPKIAIQVCTFKRPKEIVKTVSALIKYLVYPKELVTLYVSDDSTGNGYLERLAKLKTFQYWETRFISTSHRSGWGANVNNGLSQIKEDIIFFLEDDYVLTAPLDLRPGVALLEVLPHVGMVRYRGSSGGRYLFHQFEADISPFKEVFQGEWYEGIPIAPFKVTYLQFDRASPTLYIYSNGPHLKKRSFHQIYGKYPEHLPLGKTEEAFAHMVQDLMRRDPDNAPGVVILPDWVTMKFDHIGVSFQLTKEDI